MHENLLVNFFFLLFFLSSIFSPVTVGFFFSFSKLVISELVILILKPRGDLSLPFKDDPCSFPRPCSVRPGYLCSDLWPDRPSFTVILLMPANPILPQEPLHSEFSLPGTSSTKFFMSLTCRSLRESLLAHLVKNNPVTIIFCPIIFIALTSPWCIFADICVLICRHIHI